VFDGCSRSGHARPNVEWKDAAAEVEWKDAAAEPYNLTRATPAMTTAMPSAWRAEM
jgi:hypothetical protein